MFSIFRELHQNIYCTGVTGCPHSPSPRSVFCSYAFPPPSYTYIQHTSSITSQLGLPLFKLCWPLDTRKKFAFVWLDQRAVADLCHVTLPPPAALTPPPLPHNAAVEKEVEVGEGVDKPSPVRAQKKSRGHNKKGHIHLRYIHTISHQGGEHVILGR